jgi:hypothetical protein
LHDLETRLLAAKKDHAVGPDFRDVSLDAVPILAASGLQAAFDLHLFAVGQAVGKVLRPPKHDVVPLGFFFPFVGLTFFQRLVATLKFVTDTAWRGIRLRDRLACAHVGQFRDITSDKRRSGRSH